MSRRGKVAALAQVWVLAAPSGRGRWSVFCTGCGLRQTGTAAQAREAVARHCCEAAA